MNEYTNSNLGDWKIKDIIGHGDNGPIYRVYRDLSGDYYAMKYHKLSVHEIELHKICAAAGIAPTVIDSWTTGDDKGVLIMSLLKKPVYELINQYPLFKDRLHIFECIIRLIDKIYALGIVHSDIHLGNIMVDSKFNNCNIEDYDYYIIDFGCAYIRDSTTSDPFFDYQLTHLLFDDRITWDDNSDFRIIFLKMLNENYTIIKDMLS